MNQLAPKGRILWADITLIMVAMLWGTSFPLIKEALSQTSVANLVFLRFSLAWLMLLPVAWLKRKSFSRGNVAPGLICGGFLFLAFMTQAWGLTYTTASRSAFITGLNVVLVPLLSIWLFRKMPGTLAMIGAGLAFAGLYALTASGQAQGVPYNLGDTLTLFCAIFAAAHVLGLGRFSPGRDSFWLAYIQFSIIGLAGLLWALLTGELTFSVPLTVWITCLYLASGCTVVAFWTQTWAQSFTTPTRTALIFTLEPVFGALCAYVWLDERMGNMGVLGGALIVSGIILAELKPQPWLISPKTIPVRTGERHRGKNGL